MKPITLTLSIDEVASIRYALKRAEPYVQAARVPTGDTMNQIEKATKILSRPMEGGYESQEELDAAAMQSFAEEVARHARD